MAHRSPSDWTETDDALLRSAYERRETVAVIAANIGRTPSAVRNRAYDLRITRDQAWPEELKQELRDHYAKAGEDGVLGLAALAEKWGRSRPNLCRAARRLGLTNQRRRKVEERKDRRKYGDMAAYRAALPELAKARIAKHGHARGMLGKHHSAEVKERLRQSSLAYNASLSTTARSERATKMMKTNLVRYGRVVASAHERGSWKAGWREIGDRRHYFRSRWEANYARYLQWLKERGDILDWEYEPETFWFEGIKRGVRSYLPDFRVHELSGGKPLHEVKGWMDARSKTTLKRMAKYHPQETIILIREKDYKALSRFSALIGDWE